MTKSCVCLINMYSYLPLLFLRRVHRQGSGPRCGNDMQMPQSVGENSTVISANAVGKQTMGARDRSGFPIVVWSDRDADVDTAVGDGGEREEGEGVGKLRGRSRNEEGGEGKER